MTTGPTEGRQRNLTIREKEAIILGALKRRVKLQGDPTSPEYGSSAETAWDEITTEVNAVNTSGVTRSKDFIRKQFRNWKSEVNGKLASNTTKRGLIGGREFDVSALNSLDQQKARLITKEVLGIKGAMEIGLENSIKDDKSEQSPVHLLHRFIL